MIKLLRRYHASLVAKAERSAEEGGVNGLMLDLQWAVMPCLLPLLAMLLLMVVMPLSEPTRHGLALIAGGLSITWMLYVSAIFVRAFWGQMDVKKRGPGDM